MEDLLYKTWALKYNCGKEKTFRSYLILLYYTNLVSMQSGGSVAISKKQI